VPKPSSTTATIAKPSTTMTTMKPSTTTTAKPSAGGGVGF
jgi:hypothetical protein